MPISNKTIFSFRCEGAQEFERAIYSCDYEAVTKMLQTNVAASYLDYEDAGIAILLMESGNPKFAEKVITFVEDNELGYIWSQTRDGITPMQAARYTSPEMIKVLVKHLYKKPRGNVAREKMNYDFRSENNADEIAKYSVTRKMEELAFYYHYQSLRKDNITGAYEHPKAVVKMLEEFGVTDPVTLAIAWGHDLIEDEKILDKIIIKTSSEYGKTVLEGIKALTFLPTDETNKELKAKEKELYLKNIGEKASLELLLIKIADIFCNTLDFKKLSGKERAVDYLKKGKAIIEQHGRLSENLEKTVLDKLKEVVQIICQRNNINQENNVESPNYNPGHYSISEILIKEFEKRFPDNAKSVFIPNVEIWESHIKDFVIKYPKCKFTLANTKKSYLNELSRCLANCPNVEIITTEKNALFTNPGKFDLIFALPYIGLLEYSIMSYKQKLNKPELRAISEFAGLLNDCGRLIMIMPECFVFSANPSYKNLRNHLINNYKITEISYLPSRLLNNYIKTSLINLTTGKTDRVKIKRYELAIDIEKETEHSIEHLKENWFIHN